MKTTAKDGQCLVDMALMTTGSVEGVWLLALRNGLTLTSELSHGQVITWENDDVIDARVTERYATERIFPATAVSEELMNDLFGIIKVTVRPPYEDIFADDVPAQSTKAQIHTAEFTAAFA